MSLPSDARVSVQDVLDIMPNSQLTTAQMEAFITSAHILVDIVVTDSSIDETQLTEIERWLSAHLPVPPKAAPPMSPAVTGRIRFRPGLPAARLGLHSAGTETSDDWTGYMDGAIRAGKRAAGEVLAASGRA